MKKLILYCSLSALPMQGLVAQVTKLQAIAKPQAAPMIVRMR